MLLLKTYFIGCGLIVGAKLFLVLAGISGTKRLRRSVEVTEEGRLITILIRLSLITLMTNDPQLQCGANAWSILCSASLLFLCIFVRAAHFSCDKWLLVWVSCCVAILRRSLFNVAKLNIQF